MASSGDEHEKKTLIIFCATRITLDVLRKPFLAWAWLAKPKAIVIIPKFQPSPKYLRKKKRVKVQSTACHYATKRPVEITMHLGLNIIIKLKLQQFFDRCAILNVLNCLTKNLSLDELIHNYKLVRIKADGNSRILFSIYNFSIY